MFNDLNTDGEEEITSNQAKKKKEEHVEMKQEVVHSSLEYHTIKVPPLVEYTSIDTYCERRGEKYLSDAAPRISSLSRIASPVVLRTPQPSQPDTLLPNECLPYSFFSVEELSLVKSLINWTNLNVCPVGKLDYNSCGTNECYLNSVGENGRWKILLDVSILLVIPTPHKSLQVYGTLSIQEEKPKITVDFVRDLRTADLSLFVESYGLVQRYAPKSINVLKVCGGGALNIIERESGCRL